MVPPQDPIELIETYFFHFPFTDAHGMCIAVHMIVKRLFKVELNCNYICNYGVTALKIVLVHMFSVLQLKLGHVY